MGITLHKAFIIKEVISGPRPFVLTNLHDLLRFILIFTQAGCVHRLCVAILIAHWANYDYIGGREGCPAIPLKHSLSPTKVDMSLALISMTASSRFLERLSQILEVLGGSQPRLRRVVAHVKLQSLVNCKQILSCIPQYLLRSL